MTVSLAALLVQETKARIYAAGLEVATDLGLPVTTWSAGDPTRSLYHFMAETLEALESMIAGYVASGFLSYATGEFLQLLASEVYDVDFVEETFATTTVVLSNAGGGVYPIEAGDVTVKNSTTGVTYRNTTGGTIASGPGTTLTVTVVADEGGSDGSAGIGEIDEMVTTFLGVTCSNDAAAVGLDEESDASIRERCRDKLGAFSPNGPADAYAYVARTAALTGTSGITRVRVYPDSDTGDVLVYLAGPAGAVSAPDLALGEAAILEWATPLCITPTVAAASNVTIAVTYTIWLYQAVGVTEAEAEAAIETALEDMFAVRPIGGDILTGDLTGSMFKSLIESTIRGVYPDDCFRVSVSAPAGDTALTNAQVAALGTVTATAVNFVSDP
jgi:phage-related baseplate assembly protein